MNCTHTHTHTHTPHAEGEEDSQPPHRPCSPSSVRTGPAGIPGCVDVRAHTRDAREPRACVPQLRPLPSALPSSSSSLSVSDSWQKNCPQLSNQPHKLRTCFQVPTDSQGLWEAHEQYHSDPWAPGHAVLCVWKPERRSFTHSRSHDRSLEVRFFRRQSESSRPYMLGVGLTQQIA